MTKVVHCQCGTDVEAETDDALVAEVSRHVDERHPELQGQMTREQILQMAHEP